MVSKGTATSPPVATTSSPTAECCMCGDRGLTEELFRCKVCLVRSQHKYCSNLYPKSEFYQSCNWCLSVEAAKLPKEVKAKETSSSIPLTKNDSNGCSSSGLKLRRGNIPPHELMNKPIKKLRMLERSASDITDHLRSEALLPPRLAGKSGKQVFRGKVRRYKLLEEVSS